MTLLRAKHLSTRVLMRGEVPIQDKRLAELERKERAHDAYMAATRVMADHLVRLDMQRGGLGARDQGYRDCLRDFSLAVLDAARRAA